MTGILSIITPIYSPDPGMLRAAWKSLEAQSVPDGWSWEWIVQEDGRTGLARDILPDDPRIKHGDNRHLGVALTRNLGLSRAAGHLIKNLDQDDVLAEGVIGRDIEVFEQNPTVQWTTSRVLDLLPDGTTIGFENDPPHGVLAPGFVLEHWRSHNFRLPVHPTTICIRRTLAVALGGWMAVPGSDDTGLLVAASVVSKGFFRSEVGLLYRKWPGQQSASSEHSEPIEWQLRMHLIEERAEALRTASDAFGQVHEKAA